MGIVKKAVSGIFGGLAGKMAGMGKDKPAAAAAAAAPVDKSVDVAETEEDRRRRILAMNSGGNQGQLTAAGGDQTQAATGRKALLGL